MVFIDSANQCKMQDLKRAIAERILYASLNDFSVYEELMRPSWYALHGSHSFLFFALANCSRVLVLEVLFYYYESDSSRYYDHSTYMIYIARYRYIYKTDLAIYQYNQFTRNIQYTIHILPLPADKAMP